MALITSYNVLENQVDVSPVFNQIPIIDQINLFDAITNVQPATSTEIKWYSDQRIPLSTYVSASFTSGSTTLSVTSLNGLAENSLIKVEGQQFKVTSVSGSALTLSYLGGEDRADVAAGKKVYFMGNASVEGNEYSDSNYTPKIPHVNYTQIFTRYFKISNTELVVGRDVKFGDMIAEESEKQLKFLKVGLGNACVLGIAASGSSDVSRQMGGVVSLIKNYGYAPAASAWDSGSNMDAFLNDLTLDYGSMVNELWMNGTTMAYFSALNKDKMIVQQDSVIAGNFVNKYVSKYGKMYTLRIDPSFTAKKVYAFNSSDVTLKVLRSFATSILGKTGSNVKGQVEGEFSLTLQNPNACGIYTIQ